MATALRGTNKKTPGICELLGLRESDAPDGAKP